MVCGEIMIRYAKEFYRFLKHIVENKRLLVTLVKNDFKKQYLGSYFGLFWAFAQPITYMIVIWFVFTYGFRSAPNSNMPHFLWLMSGMIPWFFVSNALTSGTNSIISNAFLVKKVAFRVSILPLVQIGSSLILHLGLLIFLIVMFFFYGFKPSIYWLQIPYYIFCILFLTLSLSWITSAIRVFVKDISNIITVVLQIGFWATPIFWDIEKISPKYQWILKLNPAYYIVEGYRNMFINHKWFWEMTNTTLYFLVMCSITFVVGAIIFKRLRPHFGDVL